MAHTNRAEAYSPAIREEAVGKATGRAWSEWFALLDQSQAQSWSHAAIARWLATEHGVTAWWSQTVTVEYERARGRREVHQKSEGFAASASKTLALSVDEFHRWWAEPPRRRQWFATASLTLRKSTPPKSIRFTCPDGSRVNATFFAKGEHKSQVTIDHEMLPDAASVAKVKAEWKTALARLEALTADPGKAPPAPKT